MENSSNNFDKIFREKFENFAPPPPDKIWDGIEKGIVVTPTPSFIASYGKQIAAAAALLIITAAAVWYFTPSEQTSTPEEIITEAPNQITGEEESQNMPAADADVEETDPSAFESITKEIQEEPIDQTVQQPIMIDEENNTAQFTVEPVIVIADEVELVSTESLADRGEPFTLNYIAIKDVPLENTSAASMAEPKTARPTIDIAEATAFQSTAKKGSWSTGFYFSPEVLLNDFDSVELLPTYSFNIEPTFYSNKHWFVRFGLGLSYSRDRGFAKLDYVSNDYMGSYDDVYDVTFDTIGGQHVPNYITEVVEVWDSIPHIAITQITNNYLYLQAPLLFGYHNDKNKNLRWYFYGGPAVNLMVSKNIEEPSAEFEGVDIKGVENKLPERSPYYMQLWLGAGVEIRASKSLSVALEPNYRYYFNHVFKEDAYKTSLSGFSFRIGLVYSFK